MTEKTALLPTAPADDRFTDQQSSSAQGGTRANGQYPDVRIVLAPGLEFDPSRRYRYGLHALTAAVFVFIAFCLVELRDCNWGVGIDLKTLQGLHVALMVMALVLFLLSLFGIADFLFKYKAVFLIGLLMIYILIGLMIWMTYEAATNPCVKTGNTIPVDFDLTVNKDVFYRNDAVGIIVLLLDIIATLMMISAAYNFYKRY